MTYFLSWRGQAWAKARGCCRATWPVTESAILSALLLGSVFFSDFCGTSAASSRGGTNRSRGGTNMVVETSGYLGTKIHR